MKINYNKIINIKNVQDLKYFELNKPIYNNNYLFHYLILLDNLEGLKLHKFPIYMENNYGLNGIQLAAQEKNFKILYYLIENYKDYIYNKNKGKRTFINYLDIKELIKLIKKYKKTIKWKYLINEQILTELIYTSNYNDLLFLLKFSFIKKFNNIIYILLRNIKITDIELIKIFDLYTNKEINYLGYKSYNFIHYVLEYKESDNIIKYLMNRKLKFDYFDMRTRNSIIDIAIKSELTQETIELLINYLISSDKNFENKQNNNYLDNIIHIILLNRIQNLIDDDFTIKLLSKFKKSSLWHQVNIDKFTPLGLIMNLNFELYSNIISNNKIKINNKLLKKLKMIINNITDLLKKNKLYENYNKWINFYDKLLNYDIPKNMVKLKKYKYAQYNLFDPTEKEILLITIYICNKYNNLYLPTIKNSNDKIYLNNFYFFTLPTSELYPWIIYYDELLNSAFIHSNLNGLINIQKNKNNKRFGFIFLSIATRSGGKHANILIYDFKKLTIERFEPYGYLQDNNLDNILNEELTWNTGFKYYSPKKFMNVNGFQNVSDETNNINIKKGDVGGFCLSWCYWYLESKILNENIEPKKLVKLLFKKINNSKYKFSEYIRNYANYLNKQKNKILIKSGINKINIYDYIQNNENILNYINNFFNNLN